MRILHGDTLIEGVPADAGDGVVIRAESDDYSRAAVELAGDKVTRLEVAASGTRMRATVPSPAVTSHSATRIAGAGAIDLDTGQAETVMPGDCFSSMLHNSRAGRIAVIDPRGHAKAGQRSIFGSVGYELAKLSHSVVD